MSINQTYIISVSAGKGCYRHIRISAGAFLLELHTEILDAFDFIDDHAHAFFMDNRAWSDADSYYSDIIEDESRYTCDFKLDTLSLEVGKKFKYIFDFGEEWIFQCKVLHVLDEPCDTPIVVRSVGDMLEQYPPEAEFGDRNEGATEEFDSQTDELDFPELYSTAKLKKLYAKLTLPEDTVLMLHTYFETISRLYGVISLRKALEIINSQNDPISEKDFLSFAEIVRHEQNYFCILGEDELYADGKTPAPLDREIVEESLYALDSDDYENMVNSQEGKAFYIPPKEELLKYADQDYYEPTKQSRAMYNYFRYRKGMTEPESNDFLLELQLAASMGDHNLEYVINDMSRMGLDFIDQEDTNLFLTLYNDLSNNTRIGQNRGYTPVELYMALPPEQRIPKTISFGPNMSEGLRNGTMDIEEYRRSILKMELPNESLRQSMLAELDRIGSAAVPKPVSDVKKQKVGRNDPCPCGSGMKYKKCCGKN